MPVKEGGLGVRRVISLALPAFLASAASTLSPQDAILSGSNCSDNRYFQSYLTTWSSRYGTVPQTLPTKQPFWDRRTALLADRAVVEASLNSPHQRTSYLSASSPHSGDWLYAMPITSYNTIQKKYNTKFVKRHVALASEALANRSVRKQRRRRTNVL